MTPSKNNTNNTGGAYSNYLGYFGGFFGTKTPTTKEDTTVTEIPIKSGNATRGNITPKPESPKSVLKNKEPDLNSDYKTINTTSNQKPFDNLDNKLSTIPNDKLEFKYTPFDLVKLFKEFTKKKLDENEISKFFNELINWYSDLLYNVNLTLVEVKELNDLKIALNARYKAYFKHSKKLEEENNSFKAQIQKFSSLKEENEQLKHSRYEEERKVQELKAEKSKILCSLGENQKLINSFRQKWLNTESEYLRFKQLFKNELRNLRFEFDESQQEKKEIVELLVKFKNFCSDNKIFEGN